MTFSGIFSALGTTFKYVVISLALAYGLLLAINAVDEDLTPEAKALLAIPKIKADSDNGYLALLGINAPPIQDIVTYGTQWVDTYNAAIDKAALEKANSRFNNSKPSFRGEEKLLCNPSRTSCLPQARKYTELWRKFATDNELLLARQRRVTGFSHFEECYFAPVDESPDPYLYMSSRLLELDMIALDAVEGRLEPALVALEARISFDRRALLGCRSLVPGMIATSWLEQDYALLAEIVATEYRALGAQRDRLVRMTEPLDLSQIRTICGRLVEGDRRITFNFALKALDVEALKRPTARESIVDLLNDVIRAFDGASWWLSLVQQPFFKPRASVNLAANNLAAFQAQLTDFTTENSDAWLAKVQQADKNHADASIHTWRVLYNPTGKYALSIRQEYEPYLARLSNLIGITRLARLQVEVATDGKAKADIADFIAANKSLYDPYTAKPMGWEAGKRQLYFDSYHEIPKKTPKRIRIGI